MWSRTLGLALSSMMILVTSFCVHNQKGRDVSQASIVDISKEVTPQIFTDSRGNKLLVYHKVNSVEPVTTIQVRYWCYGARESQDWDNFNAAEWIENIKSPKRVDSSLVHVRYLPFALFYIDENKDRPEDRASVPTDKIFDLNVACPAAR